MRKNIVLPATSGIVIVVILIISILNFFGISIYPLSVSYCGCHRMLPNQLFLILAVLLIISVTLFSYYFLSKRMERKIDSQIEMLSKIISKREKKEKENKSLLKFFRDTERIVIEALIENGGKMLQSDLSKMKNMTKLKVHRAIKSLESKGVVKTESQGKTNKVTLVKGVRELLEGAN